MSTYTCEHESCKKAFAKSYALERHYDTLHSTESLAAKEFSLQLKQSTKRRRLESSVPDELRKKQTNNAPCSKSIYSAETPNHATHEKAKVSKLYKHIITTKPREISLLMNFVPVPVVSERETTDKDHSKEKNYKGNTTMNDRSEVSKYIGSLNVLEQRMARFSFDAELSNSEYER